MGNVTFGNCILKTCAWTETPRIDGLERRAWGSGHARAPGGRFANQGPGHANQGTLEHRADRRAGGSRTTNHEPRTGSGFGTFHCPVRQAARGMINGQ